MPCLLALIAAVSFPTFAQEPTTPRQKDAIRAQEKKKDRSWSWKLETVAEVTYDDNVFRLSDDRIDRLEEDRADDQVSGRFDDMESVDDVILGGGVRLSAEGRGIGDQHLRVRPRARYEYYIENTEKSHPEFGIDLQHGLGSGRSLGLEVSYALDVFSKNYLADAIDLTDSVQADERVYDQGIYDAWDAELAYRQRLWKGKHGLLGVESVHAKALLGYRNVNFEEPFDNRDLDIFRAGLGVDFEFKEILTVGIHYIFGHVDAPGDEEVVIRDEDDFDVDFNGDGDVTDNNIRTEQKVDRSRLEHEIGARAEFRLGKRWSLWAGYDALFQDFQSDEPFDLAYNGRDDLRHRVRAGIEWRFAPKWWAELQGQGIHETVSKSGLAAEEEDREYERYIVSLSVGHRW